MVHSNGTRFESHLFRIDLTGRKKYSGRPSDFRDVSAAGEAAARRAMPTRGAAASASKRAATSRVPPPARRAPWAGGDGGGQSAVGQLERLPLEPVATGAATPIGSEVFPENSLPASGLGFGLCTTGQTGKRADC